MRLWPMPVIGLCTLRKWRSYTWREWWGGSNQWFEDGEFSADNEDQIFDLVATPSFVTVFTGVSAEPLYFLKISEKGVSSDAISDTWGHVIPSGQKYFKGNYLKTVRSRNISFKKFEILPLDVYITPNEVFDTYVEIDDDLLLNIMIYKELIRKATI